ncbi:MAG: helix-turn-helix domain-containing protein [Candidatus Freyarchaeota archaeon]|nr:helix-turn-helix domain-containing protein [Candidatus Jordarchaeia archaeon]MBS7267887.1 helix-turn-helix domain-containing protein [Candidatus Jordarchaeia archaeon]MBS7279049.1 helix-turn-helix domain-containing protein [Candidatus Jordarchaeia archaeon]
MEKFYTTGEVAKLFRVSCVAVKKWAYAGKIKFIKTPGGKFRCPESEVGRLLAMLFERFFLTVPSI